LGLAQNFSQLEGKIIKQITVEFPLPLSKQKLDQALLVKQGEPLNFNRVRESVANLYRLQEFQNVRVEAQEGESGLTIIFFLVPRNFLDGIFFEGNEALSSSFLRDQLTFKVGEEWFSEDLSPIIEEVRALHEREGFFRASIEVIEKIDIQSQKAFLFVSVQEGSPARIVEIKIKGDLVFSIQKIKIPPRKGIQTQ